MKILFGLSYYRPHISGITVYAENLAECLVDRGHDVVVLTSRHHRDLALQEELRGVTIIRIPVSLQIGRGPLMARLPRGVVQWVRWADVINCHLPQFECLLFVVAGRRLGKRSVLTHHTDLSGWSGLVNRVSEGAVATSQYLAAALSAHIVTYTDDYAQHSAFLQHYRSRVTSIYPPVRRHPVDLRLKAELRKKIGSHGKVVGFAGRIVRQKGIPQLLRAMDYLVREVPDAALVLAGPYQEVVGENHLGELHAELVGCRHPVIFLGPLEPNKMASFYDLLDVLVLPSDDRLESFGLVQVEAMFQGCPVVSTDLPGARVPVRATGMGKVVPPGDPETLARAIMAVLADRERYVRPESTILETFNWERTCKRYEGLFDRAISGRRGRSGLR